MSFFNSYICPQCKTQFPFFIRPSMRIRRGLLVPYYKCQNCAQICRPKINFKSAIWIWPITICYFLAMTYLLRPLGSTLLYILIVLLVVLLPFFIGLRRGFILVSVDHNKIEKNRFLKWILPATFIILFSLLFAYYTHDWINVFIGVIIGLLAWAFFYYFSGKKITD